jgi:ABC-2 type transport system permease protein
VSASTAAAPGGVARPRRGRAGVLDAYRAERRKLTAQLATRVLALACGLAPLAFGAVLALQSGVPADTLLGVWVHESGFAVSFVVLGFCGYLGFPVLAGVLAGDVFSAEDRYGTWKSVLTRSRSRGELFAGKCLAVLVLVAALLALTAISSLLAGLLFDGGHAMVGLAGNVLPAGEALWLLALSWLVSLPPLLAFASLAVLLSVASRSGIVGVVGPVLVALVMQLLALVGSGSWMHALLVTNAFAGWHGLLAAPRFYAPLLIACAVSLLWIAACLGGAWLLLRRRDFAGPPLARRGGWIAPARAVAATAALVVLLGLAGGAGPAAVTRARLEASVSSVFERLTALQQRELGRPVPAGARLGLLTRCFRHAGRSVGPGDDWSCSLILVRPAGGPEALQTTNVTYDTSVRSEGCYKAQAPPSFVGSQTMTDARGRSVVNPLFSIYGCFDTSAAAPRTAAGPRRREPKQTAPQREAERSSLREAEQQAGPKVMREIQEAERRERRNAEGPEGAAPPHAK